MSNQAVDRAVTDYLTRLGDLAHELPAVQREELMTAITEHITDARSTGVVDEVSTRTMLDRLGDPADIVAAAAADLPPGARPLAPVDRPAGRNRGTGLEITAVVLLTAGSLIPLLGWAAGIVLVWCSRRWRRSEKLLATLVFPGGAGLALWVGLIGSGLVIATVSCTSESTGTAGGQVNSSQVCTGPGGGLSAVLAVAGFVVAVVAPLVVAAVLLHRARARDGAPDGPAVARSSDTLAA